MATTKPDTFADLDALAAKGDGRLWHCRDGNVWSYPAAPIDPHASLRVPTESAPDSRIRAALDAGAWIVAALDNLSTAIRIMAVIKAPESGAAVRPLLPTELGSAAA